MHSAYDIFGLLAPVDHALANLRKPKENLKGKLDEKLREVKDISHLRCYVKPAKRDPPPTQICLERSSQRKSTKPLFFNKCLFSEKNSPSLFQQVF